MGFSTCMYANLFEFGWNVTDPKVEPGVPADCHEPRPADPFASCHEDTRCSSNHVLRDRFTQSIMRDWATDAMLQPKVRARRGGETLPKRACLCWGCLLRDPLLPPPHHPPREGAATQTNPSVAAADLALLDCWCVPHICLLARDLGKRVASGRHAP